MSRFLVMGLVVLALGCSAPPGGPTFCAEDQQMAEAPAVAAEFWAETGEALDEIQPLPTLSYCVEPTAWTEFELDSIRLGMTMWNDALDAEVFSLRGSDCEHTVISHGPQHPGTASVHGADIAVSLNSANLAGVGGWLPILVAHELGHVLGLDHQPEGLMMSGEDYLDRCGDMPAYPPSSKLEIDQYTIDQVCEIWGC